MAAIMFLYGMLLLLYSTMLKSGKVTIILMNSMHCIFNIIEANELRIIGTNGMHACPGSIVTLECTVNGRIGDATVWTGTAFSDCDLSEITLLHIRYMEEEITTGTCSNGVITGRSLRIEGNLYVSQLEIVVNPEMVGKSIVCAHDNGTSSYIIGSYLINTGIHCNC